MEFTNKQEHARTEIIKLNALLEQGALSLEEHDELVRNQLELTELCEDLEDEELKIQAQKAIQALILLAKLS